MAWKAIIKYSQRKNGLLRNAKKSQNYLMSLHVAKDRKNHQRYWCTKVFRRIWKVNLHYFFTPKRKHMYAVNVGEA